MAQRGHEYVSRILKNCSAALQTSKGAQFFLCRKRTSIDSTCYFSYRYSNELILLIKIIKMFKVDLDSMTSKWQKFKKKSNSGIRLVKSYFCFQQYTFSLFSIHFTPRHFRIRLKKMHKKRGINRKSTQDRYCVEPKGTWR